MKPNVTHQDDDRSRSPPDPVETAAKTGVVHQVRVLLGALRVSPVGKTLATLAGGIVVVVAFTAYAQIELNSWNKPFYDAISRRDLRDFVLQLGIFAVIAGVLLVLNVAQKWLVETLQLKLRKALVTDLVGLWMQPGRALWLEGSGPAASTAPPGR